MKINNQTNIYKLNLITDIDSFKKIVKNYLIEYTNTNYSESYGFVCNILYNEMNDLINNIELITENKIIIKNNYIYNLKDSEINFKNIDISYPEPVKNIFVNTINNFLNSQNI